ncbi:MAG: ABC transporter permease subunit [Syntrophorhabdales bacterium]
MAGIFSIFRKEMEDYFSSTRFVLIAALIVMVGIIIASMVGMTIREEVRGMAKPTLLFLYLFTSTGKLFSFVQFIGFFGPLIGIVLGFDAINRERAARTLSKLVSQPIYRDAIINGKFLAGVATIGIILVSIVLVISGIGIRMLGIIPGTEEVLRLAIYLVIGLFYISFWLGISILFSVVFKSTSTSALAALALWIFSSFLVPLAAGFVSDALAPVGQTSGGEVEAVLRHEDIQRTISLLSPAKVYGDATSTVLDPMRKTTSSVVLVGPLERISQERFQNPLPLRDSLSIVAPHVISLFALTFLCFGICYLVFIKQEIRTI